MIIKRQAEKKIVQLSKQFKSVAIIGPRQSGKTTLAKICFPKKKYVSLENIDIRNFAEEDPKQFLNNYPDGAILDEVQRVPGLLSYLQQNLDSTNQKGKFILTGSNNFLLLENITQTLTGRVAYIELLPFSITELQKVKNSLDDINTLLLKGSYPPLHTENISSGDWFSSYVRTYVERDVRQIKNIGNLYLFEKLLFLCAGRIGSQINFSNLAVEVGVDYKTIQAWLSILQASYIIYFLNPYYKNFNKRITKAPKLYFYDVGLASYLLRIPNKEMMAQHPYRSNLFENFIVNELLKNRFNSGLQSNLYYWRDSSGHEIDVIVDQGINILPVEIKSGETITKEYFKGLDFWQKLTGNSGGIIFYAGSSNQKRSGNIRVLNWRKVTKY